MISFGEYNSFILKYLNDMMDHLLRYRLDSPFNLNDERVDDITQFVIC